jgi:hypothetical protein
MLNRIEFFIRLKVPDVRKIKKRQSLESCIIMWFFKNVEKAESENPHK